MSDKTIRIREDLWFELMEKKLKGGFKRVDDLISHILKEIGLGGKK